MWKGSGGNSIELVEKTALACEECPAHLINPEWFPISYFGEIRSANAWIVSINPSQREFTDRTGNLLKGNNQRFHIVADFTDCRSRRDAICTYLKEVVHMQDTVFLRTPYRAYFNRLGSFLLEIHGSDPNPEPLKALTLGTRQDGKQYLYAHLDMVKCATRRPWSSLTVADKELLLDNCAIHFEAQLRAYRNLELLVVNGRTAHDACVSLLQERFGATLQTQSIGDSSFRCEVTWGRVNIGTQTVQMVGWSSNVVRQRLRWEQRRLVAVFIRELIRRLGNNN